jgi:hypothetical protein
VPTVPNPPFRRLSIRLRASTVVRAIALASGLGLAPAFAEAPPPERWVISSGDGHAVLSFTTQANGAPEIMFICGASHRGMAQVLVFQGPEPDHAEHVRIELTAGNTSAMAAAEPTALRGNASPVLIGLIEVQQMRDLIQSSAPRLSWRVEDETGERAQNRVSLPPAESRQRREFLRFCD